MFRPLRSIRNIWLDFGPELKVKQISWKDKKLSFDYLGEALRVDFPEMLGSDEHQVITIVYHGNLRGTSPYPVWQKNDFERLQIGLDPSHLPAYFWWPCKEHGEDPADSMKISVILPQELSLFCSGKSLEQKWLAGNFVQESFAIDGPLFPDQLSLYVGNFQTIKDYHKSNGKQFPMTFYIQPDKKNEAFSHLAQVKRIFSTIDHYFGQYPRVSTGYTWFQPLDISAAKYLFRNNSWGFDPVLAHDIARQYTTFIPHNSDSIGKLIYEAFPYYVEYLLVEQWYDKSSAQKFLSQGKNPIFQVIILLEALRNQMPADQLWFDSLIGFLQQQKSGKHSSDYFKTELNSESASRMENLFSLTKKPILQYHLDGKKRKLKCYYRWKNVPAGFSYPTYLLVEDEKQKIIPTAEWKSLTFKGISPKYIYPEPAQLWYEVKQEDFLKE